MSSDQTMQLIYLVLLGVAIAGSAIVAGRKNLGKMAQQAAIWTLIFIGVIAAYGLWGDISRDVTRRQAVISANMVEVPLGRDGHYYLTLEVNGVPVEFVVDTGASQVVLTQDDAARIGFNPATLDYSRNAFTANGVVRTAPVEIGAITLGNMTDRGVPAVVNEGEMAGSLLGMSYLGLYSRIEIADDRLVLTR